MDDVYRVDRVDRVDGVDGVDIAEVADDVERTGTQVMTRHGGSMGTAPKADPVSEEPEHVPGYRDLRRIGHGGFSVVYRAVQESFERDVALKLLTIVGPDEDARRRFVREVRLSGRLSDHPHVVTV